MPITIEGKIVTQQFSSPDRGKMNMACTAFRGRLDEVFRWERMHARRSEQSDFVTA
jgi:hypothetical protein